VRLLCGRLLCGSFYGRDAAGECRDDAPVLAVGLLLPVQSGAQVGYLILEALDERTLVVRPGIVLVAPWAWLVGVHQHVHAITLALVRDGATLDAATNGLDGDAECFGCVWDSEATATSVRPGCVLVVASLHAPMLDHSEDARKPSDGLSVALGGN